MKRHIFLIPIAALMACSPALQSNIFIQSLPDMQKIDSECTNVMADKKNAHVTAVNCRFDAYEPLLGERGFQEYTDLDALKTHFISVAKQEDAHTLTDEKASALFNKYTQDFYARLQRHDNIKSRAYEIQKGQTLAIVGAIAGGLGGGMQAYSAARYPINTPIYQPSCPACQQGAQQGQATADYWQQQGQYDQQNMQSLKDAYHYNNPPSASPGIGSGARGYGGKVYVPADSNPNPPVDVLGN